jgi:hypothetical protein
VVRTLSPQLKQVNAVAMASQPVWSHRRCNIEGRFPGAQLEIRGWP